MRKIRIFVRVRNELNSFLRQRQLLRLKIHVFLTVVAVVVSKTIQFVSNA